MTISRQCAAAAAAKTASAILDCIDRGIELRSGEVLVPLDKALVRLHLEYSIQWNIKRC